MAGYAYPSQTISSTILGPLTTTFTPPPACTVAIVACSTCTSAFQAQTCYHSNSIQDEVGCWPPRTTGAFTPAMPLRAWGVYSPGLICPTGYSTACTYDGTKQTGDFNFIFRPHVSETAVGCCPTGYRCSLLPGEQTCVAALTTGAIPTATCDDGTTTLFNTQTIPFTMTEMGTPVPIYTLTAFAPLYQLVHQATDVPPKTTAPPKSAAPAKAQPKPTSTSQIPGPPPPPDQSHVNTLAGVAIGIGVTIAIFLAAAALFYLWKIKQKKQPPRAAITLMDPPPAYGNHPASNISGYSSQSGAPGTGTWSSLQQSPQAPQPPHFGPVQHQQGGYGPATMLEGGRFQYGPYQFHEVKESTKMEGPVYNNGSNYSPVSNPPPRVAEIRYEMAHEPVELGTEKIPHNMI